MKRYIVKAEASLGETQGRQHRRRGQDGYGGRALQVWLMNTLFDEKQEIIKNDYFERNYSSGQKSLPLLTLILSFLLWPPWQAMQFSRLVELREMCSSWEMFYFFYQVGEYSTIMDNGPARAAGTALKVG